MSGPPYVLASHLTEDDVRRIAREITLQVLREITEREIALTKAREGTARFDYGDGFAGLPMERQPK